MVINTSLNRRGEPMVCAPRDALAMFFASGLEHLRFSRTSTCARAVSAGGRWPEVEAVRPGSVPAPGCPCAGEDHSSRRRIAAPLERSHPDTGPRPLGGSLERAALERCPYSSLLREGLAPPPVTRLSRVGSYPTISPLPVPPRATSQRPAGSSAIGGVVSVALSLGSPRVAVNDLPALWSPDFPPANVTARRRSSVHLRPTQTYRIGNPGGDGFRQPDCRLARRRPPPARG